MEKKLVSLSKFLSLVLRHQPEVIGMKLDPEGWLDIQELIANADKNGNRFTLNDLLDVVETNDKKRFALSDDGLRIRASQGHSVSGVDLQLKPIEPPDRLYHGTVGEFIDLIKTEGLRKRSRNHVHLSDNVATATKVAERRGKAIILEVMSKEMHSDGFAFYLSANGVWLTDSVPAKYIKWS